MTTNIHNVVSFIADADSEYLQTLLVEVVLKATPKDHATITRLFDPLMATTTHKLHCVRCHKTYYEHENGDDACNIPHHEPDNERWEFITPGYQEVSQRLGCCGNVDSGDMFIHRKKGGFCIQARHTTNVDDVEYYPSDEGDDAGRKGCNENVVPCGVDCFDFEPKSAGH